MNLITRVILVGLIATVPQTPGRDSRTAAPGTVGTASIAGGVVTMRDGRREPLRRARVILQAGGGSSEIVDTDINGRFRAEHLAAGSYKIVVDKPGFVPSGRPQMVDLKDGQNANVTVGMERGAAIEGRVTGVDGEPAVGLTVSAIRLGFGPYGKKPVAVRQTTTDDLGRYRLHTLAAGDYYVEAAPDGLRTMNAPVDPVPTPKPARTYYSGTARLEDGRIVSVASGQQLTNADFATVTAVFANFDARITMSSGLAPATFGIRVQRVGFAAGEVRCLYGAGGANSFDCINVPPGEFWVLVTARSAPGADPEFGVLRLTMEGRDQRNLSIATAPGVLLNGHVEVDDGGPLPTSLQIAALEAEYEFPAGIPGASVNSATPPATVATDGTFRFPSILGSRLFRLAGASGEWAIKSVFSGDRDVTDAAVSIAAGDPPKSVRVVVTKTTGSVTGIATSTAAEPAAGTRIVVFSQDALRWGVRSRFIHTTEANASGRYAVDGLLPGKYLVVAAAQLDDGAWEDPEVLTRLQARAAGLTITGKERVTLDLRVR